jgi:NCAIR mutase (PurE)-related protein
MPPIRIILERFSQGEIELQEAEHLILREVRIDGYRRVSEIAKLDTTRLYRTGIPEVVLAEGKNVEDVLAIVNAQLELEGRVILTRVSNEHLEALKKFKVKWNSRARVAVVGNEPEFKSPRGLVGVVSAGTADITVAEEARVIAEEFGCDTISIYDVGVAGIHRLYPELPKIMSADVLIVVAGREGTLPTVIAGLTDVPVIGVPVSTGYGMGGRGEAALLSMLQSCSVLAVVNIDAGFVAGAFAAKVALRTARTKRIRND